MQVTENRDERQSPCLQDILCYVWEMVERKPRTEKALCKMKIYIQKTEQLEDNTTKIGKIVSHTDISSHLKYWHILSTQEINNEYLLLPRLWLGNGDRMVRLRFKMRIITSEFAKKGLYSQSYGFSRSHIWMWELDHNSLILVHNSSSEHWRIDAFELWWWRGLLIVPWKRPWCWEILKSGGEGDGRGSDRWMASPTQGT